MRRLAAAAALAGAALAAGAPAAGASEFVVVEFAKGVTFRAQLPAAQGPGRVVLPVTSGTVGTTTKLQHAGTLRLGGLRLSRLRTEVGRRPRVTALVSGKRRTVLTLRGRTSVRKASRRVVIDEARLVPAGVLRKRLRRSTAGRMTADVRLPAPLPAFPRPAAAAPVASSALTWHVRDSLVRYLAAAQGITASAGATAGPATVREGSDQPLRYDFAFTPAGGWHDAAGARTLLTFRGALRMRYSGHGIDLRLRDPELRLAGGRATVVAGLTDAGGTRRAELMTLDVSRLAGGAVERADGKLLASGAALLAGFYAPGDPFGAMTFAFAP